MDPSGNRGSAGSRRAANRLGHLEGLTYVRPKTLYRNGQAPARCRRLR
jgi:hypothetical protein